MVFVITSLLEFLQGSYKPSKLLSFYCSVQNLVKLTSYYKPCQKFGKDVINSYLVLRNRELENYKISEGSFKPDTITEWEKNNTLDC